MVIDKPKARLSRGQKRSKRVVTDRCDRVGLLVLSTITCTYLITKMGDNGVQDLPVVLDNEKRGLLTVEEGRLDVLQLSKEGHRE